MKKFRVILYVGGDKQWVYAYGKDERDAMQNAINDISALSAEEVTDEDEY
jgi:hypothetical protein